MQYFTRLLELLRIVNLRHVSLLVAIIASLTCVLFGFVLANIFPAADISDLQQQNKNWQNRYLNSYSQVVELERKLQRDQASLGIMHQNITSLSEAIKNTQRNNLELIDELEFYRQVIGERNRDHELQILGVDVYPDYRENSYQAYINLVRGARASRKFNGEVLLEVSYKVNGQIQSLSLREQFEFQLFLELEIKFELPAYAEIERLNVQVFDSKDKLIVEQWRDFVVDSTVNESLDDNQ